MQLYEEALERQRRRREKQAAAEAAAVAAAQGPRMRPLSPRVYSPQTLVGTLSKPAVRFVYYMGLYVGRVLLVRPRRRRSGSAGSKLSRRREAAAELLLRGHGCNRCRCVSTLLKCS
jgi:hypothetical protein